MIKANETNQILFIDRYAEEGIKLDYWWMDAGWYEHHGGGWPRVGTWLVDSNRFPRGLQGVSDHAHRQGLRVLVWFEPECVTADTWLAKQRPEWILGGAKGGLLNLGHDDARRWLTEHVDRLLTEQGIDLYRQDFNMDPLEFWRKNDAPDRQVSRRSNTSPVTSPTGMNCGGGTRTCSSIRARAADGGTTWKPCAAPCRCGGATTRMKPSGTSA
jgi:alpha-galactosidase